MALSPAGLLVILGATAAAFLASGVSADCTSGGLCSGSCGEGLNPCYNANGSQLTCCKSSCDNCDLATGLPLTPAATSAPAGTDSVQQLTLYTQRVQFGGPRHGAFPSSADTIDSGFSYNQPLFAALPADLDNPAGTPTVGVYQGKCVTTAIGGVSFAPETLECFQTYYFIIDENGSYADSISYTQAFFLNFDASTPGAITGGTGKYRFIRGEIIGAGTFTSPSGNYTYDGTTLNFLLI